MIDKKLHDFIVKMPKVELHLHLEGSIRPETAIDLMRRNRMKSVPKRAEQVRDFYRFDNLGEFVDAMRTVSDNIRHLQDLTRVADELLDCLARENVRYVEFDCAVEKYLRQGYALCDIIDAIDRSVQRAQAQYSLQARVTINLLRSHNTDSMLRLVEEVAALHHPLVVGIGLSGDERKFKQSLFRAVFERAAELGLHRTVHAGEAVGPESVWSALRDLHVERIDHGTNAHKDQELVDYLAEKKIPLTQCLTSNLKLQVVDSIKHHPFGDFFRRGLVVTLNTDDPQVFGTQLIDEYRLAAEAFHLDAEDMGKIALNGIRAAFLPEAEKETLLQELQSELQQMQNE
ncbi:MAG TPA: adenosine deaminase [bacterium]|nr:adenosine deaminase [bacterium]HOX84477.1 adenosine deaminase [bacterium]HPG45926.1 adenosine deaminase [bacterium]HPM97748.1 adenosine deaminase [bacterium]